MPLNNPDWPEIDPGDFRHRITLLEQRPDEDASGAKITFVPGTPPKIAASKVEFIRATEVLKAGQDISQVYLKITMWYRAEFRNGAHIRTPNGAEFIVQAVENVRMMNIYQVLTCIGVGAAQ